MSTTQANEGEGHELSAKAVAALIVSMGLVGLSFGAVVPLISAILENRGFSEYFTAAVTAMPALGLAIFSPAVGRLVDRYGTQWVNTLGLLGQAVAFAGLGLALATEEYLLFPIRFGLGLAAGMTFVAAEVALLRGVAERIRGRIVATYGAAIAVGFALGAFTSGLAYQTLGLWCFGIVAVGGLVIAAISHRGLSGNAGQPASHPSHSSTAAPTPYDWRPLWIAFYGVVVYSALDSAIAGTYPIEGQRLGLSRGEALNVVGLMAIGLILGQPLCGWLADRFGARRVLGGIAALGVLISLAAGLVSRQVAAGQTSGVAIAFVGLGILVGGTYPISLKLLGDRTPPEKLSTANARFSALYGVASLLGPLVAAYGIDVTESLGYRGWALPSLAGLVLVMLLPLALWDRQLSRGLYADSNLTPS